ncbi:hypothetical protein [Nocardia acidivorans]|uniref:hypothetical protein n=1 Tax=Nocardia acidivorans TaxID=404580 RepID=UPI0012F73EB1|nr:hypothetical protein [Nocardia acidivorans]
MAHTTGVGVVYSANSRRRSRRKRYTECAAAIHFTQKRAPLADVLVDANLYTGSTRKPADQQPTQDWITFQRHHRLPWAMTDSGYCAASDTTGPIAILSAAGRMGDHVIAALPVASSWLTEDASTLRDAIDKYGVPVALMIEDEADPFDRRGAVSGLVEILRADTPVLLLRSDTAALGALAYGAAAAAIGVTSTYRHFYPKADNSFGREPQLSFLIPALLGYYLNRRFENAFRVDPTLDAWRCDCHYCNGNNLTWIANHVDPSGAAFQHSVAALSAIGQELAGVIRAGVSGPSAWTRRCLEACGHSNTIRTECDETWRAKKSLAEWVRSEPSNVTG